MSGLATVTVFDPAPEKVATLFISVVVFPVPPAELNCLLGSMSQKELLTVAVLYPTRPPICVEPATLPAE